ncbi:branched-chain amino acid ABC transporter ATP-binding protein/permease [Ferviditalea candida]|uniref:Branched-chain amino acid ABC transporter ATP-binding protein/permease n=1 Tax=Ferviditalea candida TaxID=3108399 RepID=A0ABU5ZIF4_9BACL|nr:branched-chain amino acid ABC transporter ATP-binding protein/permease [Paenibacillaceae bacterium T2]
MAKIEGFDLKSRNKMGKAALAAVGIVAVLAIALPVIFKDNSYLLTQMIAIISYCIATLGLTVALGYAGQIALSQAAFFGLGAYVLAILTGMHGWSFWEAFLFGIIVPLLAGLILGAVCLRLVTHYLALATIGFGVIVYMILFNWKSVTGGADGIMNIPRPTLPFASDIMVTGAMGLGGDVWFYWFGLLLLGLSAYIVYRLRHSRLGRALLAVQEDGLAAQTNGIDMFKAKLLAFSVSAALGGLGGIVFASSYQYISPTVFTFDQSVVFFAMAIIGGSGSIAGTLLGTVFLGALPELLRDFNAFYKMIYGGLIMIFMAFLPGGIWSIVLKLFSKLNRHSVDDDEKTAIKFPQGGKLSFLEERARQAEGTNARKEAAIAAEAAVSSMAGSARHTGNGGVVPILKAEETRQAVLLEVKGLKKYFGGVKAVDGLDFNVKKGEIHVLIGPNGSGKTTVINVLSGLYTATGGSFSFKGRELTNHKPHQIVKIGLSRTFQNIRLFPELSVIDNVMIGHHSRSTTGLAGIVFTTKRAVEEEMRIRAKAEESLRFVGFTKYHALVKNLSYGQQRMVEIARALVQEPQLLLLDEPAAGMNPEETQELVKLLKRLNQLGLTLLLIEHDMDLVTEVADHVTVMDFGVKISEGTIGKVLSDPEVIKAYLGEEFVHAETQSS